MDICAPLCSFQFFGCGESGNRGIYDESLHKWILMLKFLFSMVFGNRRFGKSWTLSHGGVWVDGMEIAENCHGTVGRQESSYDGRGPPV